MFVNNIYIAAIDDDGQVLLETQYAAEDWLYIQIRDNDNKVYFTDPITLWALNKLGQSAIFRGWLLRSQLEMTIDITAAGIPAAAKLNDPISIQVTFAGYKLT